MPEKNVPRTALEAIEKNLARSAQDCSRRRLAVTPEMIYMRPGGKASRRLFERIKLKRERSGYEKGES